MIKTQQTPRCDFFSWCALGKDHEGGCASKVSLKVAEAAKEMKERLTAPPPPPEPEPVKPLDPFDVLMAQIEIIGIVGSSRQHYNAIKVALRTVHGMLKKHERAVKKTDESS